MPLDDSRLESGLSASRRRGCRAAMARQSALGCRGRSLPRRRAPTSSGVAFLLSEAGEGLRLGRGLFFSVSGSFGARGGRRSPSAFRF